MFFAIAAQGQTYALSVTEKNKDTIYEYLIGKMGLNSAAACGVLANLYHESGFSPTMDGDDGTSYGICQWHNDRMTRLMDYCSQNRYDYKTLEGQLNYLKYELSTYYPGVYNYLKSVSNTADGAYNAASYWCINYEIPLDSANKAATRGNLAKDKYWYEYNPKLNGAKYTRVLKVTSPLMYGNDVTYVQSCLKSVGYNVDIDGYYGSDTASAVTQFQKSKGLTVDGMCGQATWNALKKALSESGGAIKITTQPIDCEVKIGGTVKFTVKATGTGLSYQWQLSDDNGKNWRNSSVKTANYYTTLTKTNVNRMVRCIITDKGGNKVTSGTASMKASNLAITTQPIDCIVKIGGTVKFTVKATGTGLSYQWQLSDDNGKNWRNSSVKTANYYTTLTKTNVNRMVRCIVTDKGGNKVTSGTASMKAKQ